MSFDYSKLRGRIVEKYGSISAFAAKTDIKYPAVIRKMAGDTKFTQKDIIEWCNLLDIDIADVPIYFFSSMVQSHEHEQGGEA